MKKSSKLVFFGNERLATGLSGTAAPVLKALINNGYSVCAVVASYTVGHSRNSRELEIAKVTKKHNIPLLLPEKINSIHEQLKNFGAEAGILVAFGRILPQSIIDIFPRGIINIHPSLLPKYRGPSPIEQTILDGVLNTGVSIMSLSSKMDCGPIFAQAKISLGGNEQKQALADQLAMLGSKLLIKKLPLILNGSQKAMEQDNSKASYTKLLKKTDGLINWDQPADFIERQIRAYAGFPKSRAQVLGQEIIIIRARVAKNKDDGDLVLHCRPGWLAIQKLVAPSGRTITGSDFLNGYQR